MPEGSTSAPPGVKPMSRRLDELELAGKVKPEGFVGLSSANVVELNIRSPGRRSHLDKSTQPEAVETLV